MEFPGWLTPSPLGEDFSIMHQGSLLGTMKQEWTIEREHIAPTI